MARFEIDSTGDLESAQIGYDESHIWSFHGIRNPRIVLWNNTGSTLRGSVAAEAVVTDGHGDANFTSLNTSFTADNVVIQSGDVQILGTMQIPADSVDYASDTGGTNPQPLTEAARRDRSRFWTITWTHTLATTHRTGASNDDGVFLMLG